jgi:4-amino-4-deoxy-L-arabinose transferase-like glycosyltransferase
MDPFDHQEPIWFYGPLLLWALLPGTLLLVPLLRYLGGDRAADRRTPALGFWLLAGLWCVGFFSLSGCKLPTYILPALPPLALAVGHFLAHAPRQRPRLVAALFGCALAVQALTHYVVVPWYARYRSPLEHWEQVERLCADPQTRVVCFPRAAHSVAFYLQREDLPNYRSKDVHLLRKELAERPRTVVLFTHRHSLQGFRNTLPAGLKVTEHCHFGLAPLPWLPASVRGRAVQGLGKTALGLCDLAVIERRAGGGAEACEVP